METSLSKRDERRAGILQRLESGRITKSEAELVLGVSRRQVDRLLADYRAEGVRSVVHGNRGRIPANKTSPEILAAILPLVDKDGKYHGFNVCHICDLLAENEGIRIGRSTLDRFLRRQRIIKSGTRSKQVGRRRRERASAEGMMLQIDGSPHDWLESRGPKMSLVGGIDDATGKMIYGLFRPTEDLAGYLMMLRQITRVHGLPESLYHDRHTILRSPKGATIEDELNGRKPMSQFQRVLSELGIASIASGSPQAKGRVERLWGVLQDRLVKEMRLEGIGTIEEANDFLPGFIRRYNTRFAVKATDPEPAWVEVDPEMDLAYYFCARESRTVRSDHTLVWQDLADTARVSQQMSCWSIGECARYT
jgi:transposase